MLALSAGLLSLAYEPFGQAYLAWVGLVPWLITLRGSRSLPAAYAWGWVGGFLFYAVNLWWLWSASIPGMIAFMVYLSLYWGLAAGLLHALGALRPAGAEGPSVVDPRLPPADDRPNWRLTGYVLLIAVVWTACEWLRVVLIDPVNFPWLLLGQSQSPMLVLCQVADLAGVFGISFWVAMINGLLFVLVVWARGARALDGKAARPPQGRGATARGSRVAAASQEPPGTERDAKRTGGRIRALAPAVGMMVVVLLAVLGYGLFRMSEELDPAGPRVMLVQTNHEHLRGGLPTVPWEDAVEALLLATVEGLRSDKVDLVVWPEAAIPPLNEEARHELRATRAGQFMARTHDRLTALSAEADCSIAVGARYVGSWAQEGRERVGRIIYNSVYLYGPEGGQSADRYDKLHLASFSERVPFEGQSERLYRVMLWLSPPVADRPPTAVPTGAPTVFRIEVPGKDRDGESSKIAYRFATPICLENIFPAYISRLVLAEDGRTKQADFIANLSNDGWFAPVERYQHLQQVLFRCIENRVPQARSSNTGISALIDSCGRTLQALPPLVAGTVTGNLPLDRRITVYTRYGDVFAVACVAITAATVLARTGRRLYPRRGNVR